jgi:hypothetical protein
LKGAGIELALLLAATAQGRTAELGAKDEPSRNRLIQAAIAGRAAAQIDRKVIRLELP